MKLKYVNGSTETEMQYRELQCLELPFTEGVASTSLRGIMVEHLTCYRRVFSIRIANTNALTSVEDFVNFWTAQQKFIEDPASPGDWIEVATGFGKCPIEYKDGIVYFPVASFELQAKRPE